MALVALISLSIVLFSFSTKNTTLTQAQCLPDQRHALVQLKQGFKTNEELHSWNSSTNCCIWDGITCDKQTGMVTALNLQAKSIWGELNPALFNLSSLQYLDLSDNNFYNITLPQTGFERLGNLTLLDLSNSNFVGQVPIGISALTNLITLDLSYNTLHLHDTSLKTLLRNLTKLQVLRLDEVDISLNGSEWGSAVLHVGPTLQNLSMAGCGLRGNFPDEILHLRNITELVLSYNSMLSDQLPDSIGNLQYLSVLDLSYCNIHGEVPPSITNLTRLQEIGLGSNRLTGTIPMSLFYHPTLEYMDLSQNQLSGFLPEFSNGSSNLASIALNNNNLQGQLPISIFKSPKLDSLDISSNNFTGKFNLDVIKHNKNLYFLSLSNNKLSIMEGKNHEKSFYATFPQISYLSLASCNLTKFPYFLRYQSNINKLNLSNNKIDGAIPNWFLDAHFTSLSSLQLLDVHSNRISGHVPLLPSHLKYVDFSSNNIFSLPANFISSPVYLSLSNNSLTGKIPLSICNATLLDIRNTLLPTFSFPPRPQVLDLSYNKLTGTIPPCLLENDAFLVLNLRSNKLSGSLSQNISPACKFRTIDLSGNRINGSLPESLRNCNNLEVLDLRNNQIVDRFPFWLGNLKNLRVLVLRSNKFYGNISSMEVEMKTNDYFCPTLKVFDLSSNDFRGIIPNIVFEKMKAMETSDALSPMFRGKYGYGYSYQNSITVIWKGGEMEIKNSLSIFSSLDLSQNGFWGEIPKVIGQLKSLDGLNLSHNALTGSIPSEFSKLQQLQSLDLSCNKLSGPIPQELTSLHFLSALNLSYNNLVGKIPQVPQLSTFSNASYMGNPGLCGSPLSMQCATTPSNDGFNKDLLSKSSTYIIGLSISIGLGLGVGFASVIWVLISWENGREWFNFIVDRFYFRHIPWIVLHFRLAIGGE